MGCRHSRSAESREIRQFYNIGVPLGTGSYGEVKSCVKRTSGAEFAVKILPKSRPDVTKGRARFNVARMFRTEVGILQSLEHENIVKVYDAYEDAKSYYMVMEMCRGGELFTRVASRKYFAESHAAAICRQLLRALSYLHSRGIVHRDVKAENFVFAECDDTDTARIVMVDFGMAVRLPPGEYLHRLCGSPHYVSPELLRGRYQWGADMWAFGVILFLMLYGRYPFEAMSQRAIVKKILQSEPEYSRTQRQPSSAVVDLLRSVLCKNPETRMTAVEALQHPWLSGRGIGLSQRHISGKLIIEAQRRALADRDLEDAASQLVSGCRSFDSMTTRPLCVYVPKRTASASPEVAEVCWRLSRTTASTTPE